MIVIEKILRTLYCQRLFIVSLMRYLNFWVIRVLPFLLIYPVGGIKFYIQSGELIPYRG